MLRIWGLVLGIAAFCAATPVAEARDGCGRGWFHNGQTCVQEDYDEGPRGGYRPGYQGYQRGYDQQYYRRGDGAGFNRRTGQDCYNVGGRQICCPHQWTVQDGVCKPYRGR